MSEKVTGKCLCGAVRFSAADVPTEASVCHCEMCRRWTGGPMIAVHPKGGVEIENPAGVTWYRSSDWAERGFCPTCGSTLFYRLIEGGVVIPAAGTLDDQSRFTGVENHIFIDQKPAYYDFADTAPRLTAEETIALFTGGEEKAS